MYLALHCCNLHVVRCCCLSTELALLWCTPWNGGVGSRGGGAEGMAHVSGLTLLRLACCEMLLSFPTPGVPLKSGGSATIPRAVH